MNFTSNHEFCNPIFRFFESFHSMIFHALLQPWLLGLVWAFEFHEPAKLLVVCRSETENIVLTRTAGK